MSEYLSLARSESPLAAILRRGSMFLWRCATHPTWARAHFRSWISDDRRNYFEERVPTLSVEEALLRLRPDLAEQLPRLYALQIPSPRLQRPSINPVTDNSSSELTRLAYLLCHLIPPLRVVETGVSNGSSTFILLQALREVAPGAKLLSIDLPWLHPQARQSVGAMVPSEFFQNWELRLGDAAHVASHLGPEWSGIDLFMQDASHSYHGQLREYRAAWKLLRPGGLLISDDVGKAALTFAKESGSEPLFIGQRKDRPIALFVKKQVGAQYQ